jgi:hypothetical protein
MIPDLTATRYVTPLREGGSLPAVVETAEDGLWVVKFRGAGQGAKALIAELIVGLIAREIGLPVPDLASVQVDPAFGRTEGDPEIQDILMGSHGVNVALRYLDGAFNFEERPARDLHIVPPEMAAPLVWLDAFVMNIDRTHRNPNLLVWDRRPWLIDHGAALYFHHNWAGMNEAKARAAFPMIATHLFLEDAVDLEALDPELATLLPVETLTEILAAVPNDLLEDPVSGEEGVTAEALRKRYLDVFAARLEGPREWVRAAAALRDAKRAEAPARVESRR